MAGKMNKHSRLILAFLSLLSLNAGAALQGNITSYTTTPLTEKELHELYKPNLSAFLQNKLNNSLNSVILSSTGLEPITSLPESTTFKRKFFRVTQWNIERGFSIDMINQALNHTDDYFKKDAFKEISEEKNLKEKALIEQQISMLKDTDVFTLNEVDLGIQRTDYKNIAEEFGRIVGAAYYAFIPEFIELDKRLIEDPKLDISQYRGLHGNAIVSKFPIKSVRYIRLPSCYDWFNTEKENLVLFEKARRKTSKEIVQEEIITEVRRGDRVALIADIDLPGEASDITVVSVHIENRCLPKCRETQLKAILEKLKDSNNPVILGGDFNNFEKSAEPTTLIKIVRRTMSDPQNLARATITYFNPYSLMINPGLFVINAVRKHKDPTSPGIPIILRNKSKKLFDLIHDFKFDDKNRFDFSGEEELSYDSKDGRLSNSNQRAFKGFVETFHFHRSFGLAEYKIDWLFFKPLRVTGCDDGESDFEDIDPKCKRFIPSFGVTLKEFNSSPKNIDQFSDHHPVSAVVLI